MSQELILILLKFVQTGFNNWKKALEKERGFDRHASSRCHILAMKNKVECDARNNDQSVLAVQIKGREETDRRNRTRIRKIASALLFCARQSIATRGHYESET